MNFRNIFISSMNYILNSKNFSWHGNTGLATINQFPWIELHGPSIGVRSARTLYVMEFVFTQKLVSTTINDVTFEKFSVYTSKDGRYKILLLESVTVDV